MAMLELFLLMQQNEQITKVSSETIRLIRQHLHIIDDKFRNDIRNRSLFIEILRQPKHVSRELKRAHRYGVLAAYWPSFARIVGRMQYDLYHVYTVDHHILMVLDEARKFSKKDQCNATLYSIFNQLPKPELLYLAALFHDVGKGRKGDHSSEGAAEAVPFCLAHGLSEHDAKLVAWLAQNHLEMSIIAQQQDTSDPAVVNAFAEKTSTLVRLNYLYLLTIADINGTNPKLWNNWRATLLAELYRATASQLQLETPKDSQQLVTELQTSALNILEKSGHHKEQCYTFWEELDTDYFIHHTDDEIAWHTQAVLNIKNASEPQIDIRQLTSRGCTAIFIYSSDRQHLFANVTHCLHRLGLTIVDARIITTKNGNALDTFVVLTNEGEPISSEETCKNIEQQLYKIFQPSYKQENSVSQYIPRRLLHFNSKPSIKIINEPHAKQSCLHVQFIDYPGLLSHIADVFADLDIKVHSARVSTLGERAHDIFYITSREDQIINDPLLEKTIIQHITDRLAYETKQNNEAVNI
jgi:[protein-PII] uridylyltransferase